MSTTEIILLAIIQGITEFLPISSSAHLLLPSIILDWQEQGLAFDVAVHIGSLLAVIAYFRRDIWQISISWFASLGSRQQDDNSRLAWYIIVATAPIILVGVSAKSLVEAYLRTGMMIAISTLLFGAVLWWADRSAKQDKALTGLDWRSALMIGLAQILALIPGTSRSGITMTAALFLGFTREAAARFSFLLSIPTIAGAGILLTKDLLEQPTAVDWYTLGLGAFVAFVSAYACIYWFLAWISRIGMLPFVIYRMLLGMILLWLLWF